MNVVSDKENYPFVDLIRFVSMLGIVWAHTDAFPLGLDSYNYIKNTGEAEIYIFFKQVLKFSVICFFMISGFLLGDKIDNVEPWVYFKRRVSTTLRSYTFAFTLFVILSLIIGFFVRKEELSFFKIYHYFKYYFFYSPYWYLLTYYIGLVFILIFNKQIKTLKFGFFLLLITLYYTFQPFLYPDKDHVHTTAIFGFIFYIWLGAYIRHKELLKKIKTINLNLLLVGVIVSLLLASYQSYELFVEGKKFYFNNLRVFNQLYGILFFLFLIRVCPATVNFRGLNPRKETFGIYLYHFYVVSFIYPFLLHQIKIFFYFDVYTESALLIVLYSIILFLFTYLLTLSFVRLCLRKGWKIV